MPGVGLNGTLYNAVTDQRFSFTPKIGQKSKSIAEAKFKKHLG